MFFYRNLTTSTWSSKLVPEPLDMYRFDSLSTQLLSFGDNVLTHYLEIYNKLGIVAEMSVV